MKTKKKKVFIITATHILSFIAGIIFTAIINSSVDDFFKRPKVSCSVDCLNIVQDDDSSMRLEVYLQFKNSGKSNTSISLNDLNLQFVGINDKPYQFDIKKNLNINALSYVNETIRLSLPQNFDTLTYVPILKELEITHNEVDKNKLVSTLVDKSNVVYSFYIGRQNPQNPDSFSYTPDYIVNNGEAKMIFRKIPITFHGKTYTNMLYPREAVISYMIKDGKIHVRYHNINMLKDGQFDLLMKPIVFIPAPELEDYIVMPDGYGITISYESRENNKIKMKEYSVLIENNSKQIVYFINQKNNDR